jgi:hypothetical protein
MPGKRGSQKTKSGTVFGQARKPPRMFRAGLYARVSISQAADRMDLGPPDSGLTYSPEE